MSYATSRGAIRLVSYFGVAFSGALLLAGCGNAEDDESASFETSFMQEMTDHHAMAVDMGEICIDSATHEELRTTCQGIVTSQTAEIAQFQSWLSEWYDVADYQPQMSDDDHQQMQALESLEGEEFEIEFMDMMIEHHQQAVTDAQECTSRATHEALLSICEDIIEAQTAEIAQMETWLCDWYSMCDGARQVYRR